MSGAFVPMLVFQVLLLFAGSSALCVPVLARGAVRAARMLAEPVPTDAAATDGAMALLSVTFGRRPLGREQMGGSVYDWLSREMRWLAGDYLFMLEEESLGWLSVTQEVALIRRAAAKYGPEGLKVRCSRAASPARPSSRPPVLPLPAYPRPTRAEASPAGPERAEHTSGLCNPQAHRGAPVRPTRAARTSTHAALIDA